MNRIQEKGGKDMEEKLLEALNKINERLDKIDRRLDKVDKRLDGMDGRLDKVDKRLDGIDRRLDKVDERLDGMDRKFEETDEKMLGIEKRIAQEIRQQILDHMFVFETEYGRKISIAFEEITARNHKEMIQDETIKNLERRTDMNSAFVHSHEERITVLEKTKI